VEHAAKLALWEKYASLALAKTLVPLTTASLLGLSLWGVANITVV